MNTLISLKPFLASFILLISGVSLSRGFVLNHNAVIWGVSSLSACPSDDEKLGEGRLALSLFYANDGYDSRRLQMGVSTSQLNLDDIVPIEDSVICTQLDTHIQQSSDFGEMAKEQSKVYFWHEGTGRYFIVTYWESGHPKFTTGFSTGVYILDNNLNRLGAFGV